MCVSICRLITASMSVPDLKSCSTESPGFVSTLPFLFDLPESSSEPPANHWPLVFTVLAVPQRSPPRRLRLRKLRRTSRRFKSVCPRSRRSDRRFCYDNALSELRQDMQAEPECKHERLSAFMTVRRDNGGTLSTHLSTRSVFYKGPPKSGLDL